MSTTKSTKKTISNETGINLVDYLIFDNEKEHEHYDTYLELKGIDVHRYIINQLGLDSNNKIKYKRVADTYRYDKRLRKILYKYISALEEQIRGQVSNTYNNPIENKFKIKMDQSIKKQKSNTTLFEYLESLNFSDLMNILNNFNDENKRIMFPSIKEDKVKQKLENIRKLRNDVSHHNFIIFDENIQLELKGRILDLYSVLNPFHKEFLKNSINNALTVNDYINEDNIDQKITYQLEVDLKYIIKI